MAFKTNRQRKWFFANKNNKNRKMYRLIKGSCKAYSAINTINELKEGNSKGVIIDGVLHTIPHGSVVVVANKGLKVLGRKGFY